MHATTKIDYKINYSRNLSIIFSRRFRRKSRLLQWLVFFSSVQRALMHIYQFLPYVLSTSFSTHPKRLTWDKKRPPFTFFGTKLRKKIQKNRNFFSQFLVFWELLLSPVVEKVIFESFWALDMARLGPFSACFPIFRLFHFFCSFIC